MRIARLLAGAMAALIAALPGAAPAQESADNPPIETIRSITGDPIRIQRFQRPAFAIDPATFTIGQRKMLRAAYGEMLAQDRVVRVECPAMASGRLDAELNCRSVSGADADAQPTRIAIRLMRMAGNAFPPTIPQVPVASLRKLQRAIQFDVRIGAFPAAEPEPPAGPVVPSKDIIGLDWTRTALDYPGGARRLGAEGRMVALCQIQADLSVACVQESFDPPQNASYFAEAASALFGARHVHTVLASGAPSAGARFRYAVNFTLPK